jgi:eukaryotic-like serine/threonine-protein kinase
VNPSGRAGAFGISTASLGDVPSDPSAREAFARGRLALFGKTVFWIAVTFLGLSVLLDVGGVMPFWRPGMESHLFSTAIALGIWLLARSPAVGPMALWMLDTLGTLGICVSMAVMGYRYAAQQPWGAFAGIFAVFHVTMARAIIVPSTARRTLVVTALSFAGLVLSQSLMRGSTPLDTVGAPAWVAIVPSLTWSSTVTALATLASKVIYGLSERVFEARRLGQYTLDEKIGEGGMGEVYRASHAMLRRPTAVKLLSGKHVSEEQARRFEKEVQLTARLTHPNTISIYDYGRTPEGTFYYAMELLDGITLEQLVERHGPQRPSRVVHILLQMCGALREAHEAGLIHRDIKPANAVLCCRGGLFDIVKVLDFGLVKQIAGDVRSSLSGKDTIVGTPLFMSPEEISAPETVGAPSDLYSLGAVAYYLLSGKPVFEGGNVIEVCGHHLHTPPLPLSQRAVQPVPMDLEALILACLAKEPGARPASAQHLAERLRRCADVGTWSEHDAQSWWRTHASLAEPVHPQPAAPVSLASRTLRVDLEARRVRRG